MNKTLKEEKPKFKLSKKIRNLIIVLCFIQFCFFIFLALNNEIYTWDEASYLINGKYYAGEEISPSLVHHVAPERHPLLSWIIAGLFSLHLPLFFSKLISLFFMILFFFLIYRMGKHFYGQDVGLIASFILITIPVNVVLSVKVLSDIPASFLFSLSLYFYYKGLKEPKWFLWGGLIGGISVIMKDLNVLLAPVLILFLILFWKKINLRYYLLSAPVALFSMMPYFIDNYLRWGNPLFRILEHMKMVDNGLGYQSFSFLNHSILWVLVLPLLVGLPLFILFISNLYKRRTELTKSSKLKFLFIWFIVPFVIFLVKQKINLRLTGIFLVPVLLIGTNELLDKNKKRFCSWMIIILVLNLFLIGNFLVYTSFSLDQDSKEIFDFILSNIPEETAIYTNLSPPSLVSWYTEREAHFSLNPDEDKNITYYLFEKEYEKYMKRTKLEPANYHVLFKNQKYILYQKEKKIPKLFGRYPFISGPFYRPNLLMTLSK